MENYFMQMVIDMKKMFFPNGETYERIFRNDKPMEEVENNNFVGTEIKKENENN